MNQTSKGCLHLLVAERLDGSLQDRRVHDLPQPPVLLRLGGDVHVSLGARPSWTRAEGHVDDVQEDLGHERGRLLRVRRAQPLVHLPPSDDH
eukprot:3337966-Pyramimonas_sp.AAC.1